MRLLWTLSGALMVFGLLGAMTIGLPFLLLGAVLFAIYYANWTYGWITPDDLDFYH
jgi:hypothetical protein